MFRRSQSNTAAKLETINSERHAQRASKRTSKRTSRGHSFGALILLSVFVSLSAVACVGSDDDEVISGTTLFQLNLTNPPNTAVVGAVINPGSGVQVTLADPFGNVQRNATTAVTVALEGNSANGNLSGTLTVTPVNGVATFSDLSIDTPGLEYSLTFTANGYSQIVSGGFDVSTGVASQIGFVSQPSSTPAGSVINPPVVVAVQDAQGATITSSTATVTLSLANNPGSAQLNGTLSRQAINGLATFADLSLDKEGVGYSFEANTANLGSAASASFDITPGQIDRIRFANQPANGTVNGALSPALEVRIEDANGDLVANAGQPVTLRLATNPAQARLLGSTTVIPANGIATFADLRLDRAGAGFSFVASTAIVPSDVTSNTFDINTDAPDIVVLNVAPNMPGASLSGCVSIEYAVAQDAGEPVDILVEYDANNTGNWQRATQAAADPMLASSGVLGVPSAPGPNGQTHLFLWNSTRDLPSAMTSSTRIRVTASLRGQAGLDMTVDNLAVENGAGFSSSLVSVSVNSRSVTSGDFDRDGRQDIAVISADSQTLTVFTQDSAGSFNVAATVNTGSNPQDLQSADINNDGLLDLVYTDSMDETVSVVLQQSGSSLSFATPAAYTAEPGTGEVQVADINADGWLDLAVAAAGEITVHLQDSANPGTFLTSSDLSVGTAPVDLRIADLNGDGVVDIAVANRDSNDLSVLIQDPANLGQFMAATQVSVGMTPLGLAVADLNGDGFNDLVTANSDQGELSLLFQDSSNPGSFLAAQSLAAGTGTSDVIAADFDGDSRVDLLALNPGSNNASLFIQDPSNVGQFLSAQLLTLGQGALALELTDLNGDGKVDVLALNGTDNTISVLQNSRVNRCDPDFNASRSFVVGSDPSAAAITDLDQDGRPDLLVTNSADNSLSVLLGNGHADLSLISSATVATGAGPGALDIGDLNNDGVTDVAVANIASSTITVLQGVANDPGNFNASATIAAGTMLSDLAIGFFDDDGLKDLAYTDAAANTVNILRQNPNQAGQFMTPVAVAVGTAPSSLQWADFNGDLLGDLAIANLNSATVTVLQQVSAGQFSNTELAVGQNPRFVEVADLDGDGRTDILVCNEGDDSLSIILQDNANPGSFLAAQTVAVGQSPRSATVGDFNGDSLLDILVVNNGDNSLSLVLQDNANPGQFLAANSLESRSSPVAALARDFDGDGLADLLVLQQSGDRVELLRQGGLIDGFRMPQSLSLNAAPTQVLEGDVNGDSLVDFVTVQPASNQLEIVLQDSANPGSFLAPSRLAVNDPSQVILGRFNNDATTDIAVLSSTNGTVTVFFQDPAAAMSFPSSTVLTAGASPSDGLAADIDGDGLLDIAVTNSGSQDVTLFIQDAGSVGGFMAPSSLAVGSNPSKLASADINGDGRVDLVVLDSNGQSLSLLLQDNQAPRGSFLASSALALSNTAGLVSLADIDGNGQVDIVVAGGSTAPAVSVFLQTSMSFQETAQSALSSVPQDLAVADLDGDGALDVVLVDSNGVTILRRDLGSNSFSFITQGSLNAGPPLNGLSLADFNRDGLLDLVVVSNARNRLSLIAAR